MKTLIKKIKGSFILRFLVGVLLFIIVYSIVVGLARNESEASNYSYLEYWFISFKDDLLYIGTGGVIGLLPWIFGRMSNSKFD